MSEHQVSVCPWGVGMLRLYCSTCKRYFMEWPSNFVPMDDVAQVVLEHLGSFEDGPERVT